MSEFFQKNAAGADGEAINANDKKPDSRVDIRYDRKISTVTTAEKAGQYKVKVWPTLSEDKDDTINALGMKKDFISRHRARAVLEKKKNSFLEEMQYFLDAHAILDEEEEEDRNNSGLTGITLEELEKIRQDAFDEGVSQGHDEGFAKGHEEGLKSGQDEGYNEGLKQGSEKGYEIGFAQGKTDGYDAGHNEGIDSGQKVVLDQVERFRYLADSLANPLREVDKDVTDELAYIITRLVKVITGREIKDNPDFLKNTIEKALTVLPNAQKGATIYLSPDDYAVISATISPAYITSQTWDLKEEPKLEPGDVKVENSVAEVNWRINDRIDALLEDFLTGVYPAVDSALREPIEGCPEYNEIPKKPVAPRNLDDISQSVMSKAPKAPEAAPAAAPQEAAPAESAAAPVEEEDPAPFMDDLGHPIHQSKEGYLYYFEEDHQKMYVNENGEPIGHTPPAEPPKVDIPTDAGADPQGQGGA